MRAPTPDNSIAPPSPPPDPFAPVAVAAPVDAPEQAVARLLLTLRIVWGDRWVVIAALIAGLLGAMVYSSMNTRAPQFAATARLYVARQEPRLLDGVLGSVLGDSRDHTQTQITLIRSTTILADTLMKSEVRQLSALLRVSDRLAFLKSVVRVESGRSDDIIEISAALPDPTESARLVNAVVDAYIEYQASLRKTTAAEMIKALSTEKGKLDAELADRRAKLLAFEREAGLGGAGGGTESLVASRMTGLVARAAELNTAAAQARSLYESAEKARDDPDALRRLAFASELTAGVTLRSPLRDQIDVLQREADRYGPRAQVRIDLEEQIDSLRRAIDREERAAAAAFVDQLGERWRLMEEQQQQMKASIESEREQAFAVHEKSEQIVLMRRDIARTEALYEALATRLATINVSDESPATRVIVLDRATPAAVPVPVPRGRSVAFSLAAAFVGSMLLIGLKNVARRRLRTADQIAEALGAPVVGVVPRVTKSITPNQMARVVIERPCTQAAEAVRAIRTALIFGSPAGQCRTIVVTSPTAGMGKSTMASNLAITLAQSGRRTLLLDADFRKPRQHVVFGVRPTRTLADIVADASTVGVNELVCRTAVPGLDVLACGAPTSHPTEALASPAFADLFAELRRRYAVIVIDSVPALSVTDVQIVAAMSDTVLFVLRPATLARQVAQSRRALEAVGANLFGAVVNGVSPLEMGAHGFGAYGGCEYGYKDHVRAA